MDVILEVVKTKPYINTFNNIPTFTFSTFKLKHLSVNNYLAERKTQTLDYIKVNLQFPGLSFFKILITHYYIHIKKVCLQFELVFHLSIIITTRRSTMWHRWLLNEAFFCPSVNNPGRRSFFAYISIDKYLMNLILNLCLHTLTSTCVSQIKACKCASHLFVYFIQDETWWHLTVELDKELHQHWFNIRQRKGSILYKYVTVKDIFINLTMTATFTFLSLKYY